MDTLLKVKLTHSFRNEPLLVVANLPGEGAEFSPKQARLLAKALLLAADAAESRDLGGKHLTNRLLEIPLTGRFAS